MSTARRKLKDELTRIWLRGVHPMAAKYIYGTKEVPIVTTTWQEGYKEGYDRGHEDGMAANLDENVLKWRKYPELPKKPGIKPYEQIPCLCIPKGQKGFLRRVWNCEHHCWDDEEGDDHWGSPDKVEYWIPESDIHIPQETP